jgi:hypothetical protein
MPKPLVVIIACGTLAGCSANENLRLNLGRDVSLSSLPPPVAEPGLDADGNPLPVHSPPDDAPSVTGLDRAAFAPVDFVLPLDGTRHEPHGTRRLLIGDETARRRGEFPTAVSALDDGTEASRGSRALEIALMPFWVTYDAAALIPRLVIAPFASQRQSPNSLPGRTPERLISRGPGVLTGAPGAPPEHAEQPEQIGG